MNGKYQIKEDFVLDIKIKLLDTNYHYNIKLYIITAVVSY